MEVRGDGWERIYGGNVSVFLYRIMDISELKTSYQGCYIVAL